MKKHPLLSNLILTMAIQIGVYLIIIFELQIIEPILQALGVRSEGIMAPTEVVRFFVMRVVLIAAAISAGIIRSKVYFWIPSFLLIFVGFAIYYPDILPRVEKTNMVNLPLIAEHLGYGTIIYSAICTATITSERPQTRQKHSLTKKTNTNTLTSHRANQQLSYYLSA